VIRGPRGWDRRILALAVPALAALVADPLLSLVDTALFGMAFAVCNFLAFVTTPMVSQGLGRGDRAGATRVVNQAIVTAIGLGLVGVVVFWTASGVLVGMMQASAEVTAPAVEYLRQAGGAGLQSGQQGPLLPYPDRQGGSRCIEPEHDSGVTHRHHAVPVQDGAPAGRDDRPFAVTRRLGGEAPDLGRLQPAEGMLAILAEDLGDRLARSPLHEMVDIEKGPVR